MKFNQSICVRVEGDGRDQFLLVVGDPDKPDEIDAENGAQVATYRLVSVKKMSISKTLRG